MHAVTGLKGEHGSRERPPWPCSAPRGVPGGLAGKAAGGCGGGPGDAAGSRDAMAGPGCYAPPTPTCPAHSAPACPEPRACTWESGREEAEGGREEEAFVGGWLGGDVEGERKKIRLRERRSRRS